MTTVEDTAPLYELMAPDDVVVANETVQKALETTGSGVQNSWRNAVTGNSGTVTPIRTYKSKAGVYCRVYYETLSIGGRADSYQDTACRDKDGIWKPLQTR